MKKHISRPSIKYGPVDNEGMRWIDNAELGLRVKPASDCGFRRLSHKGYYTSPYDLHETVRGIVVQLPARRKKERYLAAIQYLEGKKPVDDAVRADCSHVFDEFSDAALSADSIAEYAAEKAREAEEAFCAAAELEDAFSSGAF